MLAISYVENTEETIYTVPSGYTAFVFVDISVIDAPASISVKVNNYQFWSGIVEDVATLKLILTAGDTIKVYTPNKVNVFVHGFLV